MIKELTNEAIQRIVKDNRNWMLDFVLEGDIDKIQSQLQIYEWFLLDFDFYLIPHYVNLVSLMMHTNPKTFPFFHDRLNGYINTAYNYLQLENDMCYTENPIAPNNTFEEKKDIIEYYVQSITPKSQLYDLYTMIQKEVDEYVSEYRRSPECILMDVETYNKLNTLKDIKSIKGVPIKITDEFHNNYMIHSKYVVNEC